MRYIVLNPLRAGLVEDIDQFHWSSYRATAGFSNVPTCLTVDWLLRQFDDNDDIARKRYQEFVTSSTDVPSPWKNIKRQLFLGRDAFIRSIAPLIDEQRPLSNEVPRPQRFVDRQPLSKILRDIGDTDRNTRNALIVKAHIEHGYKLAEIAAQSGLHYSTISKILKQRQPRS